MVALTIDSYNEDCEDTYYGCVDWGTGKFAVTIPNTNIFIATNPTAGADIWKLDIASEATAVWSADTLYNSLSYVSEAGDANKIYSCILPHTSTADDEPGTGVNWETYWRLHTCVWKSVTHVTYLNGGVADSDGNIYVAGLRSDSKTIWKLNSRGGLDWSFDIGAGGNLYGIAIDANDNIYVVGSLVVESEIVDTVWKLDTNGNLLWSYNTEVSLLCVAVDSAGNVYVGGPVNLESNKNVWKLDTNGNLLWSYKTGTGRGEVALGLAVDTDDNVYVAGDRVTDTNDEENTVWKLSSSGSIIWGYDTGNPEESLIDIDVDSAGNVYVAGPESAIGHTWKLSNSGGLVWEVSVGGNVVNVDADDSLVVGGINGGVWKLDSAGNKVWEYISEAYAQSDIVTTNLWKKPTGYNDADNLWVNEIAAYDGSLLSSAISSCEGTWSSFLELLITPDTYDKIRFQAVFEGAGSPIVDIDVYYDGDWHDIYQGEFAQSEWVEKSIAAGPLVSKARIRFSSSNTADIKLNEIDFRISNVCVIGVQADPLNTISVQKISSCCGTIWGQHTDYESGGIALDIDSNVYVATVAEGYNFTKFDGCGNFLWEIYNGADARGVAVGADGNAYFIIQPLEVPPTDAAIRKIDNSGNPLWDYSIDIDPFGIAAKGAYIYVAGTLVDNINVIKLDFDHNEIWTANTKSTVNNAVAADSAGNVYVAGNRVYDGGSWKSVWKLNSSGSILWSYDTGDDAYGIAVDEEGNVYVAGANSDLKSVWKLDSSGSIILPFPFNTGSDTYSIAVGTDGNVYVGGYEYVWVLDSLGVLSWSFRAGDVVVRGIVIND
ncbi:MAG: SBBP repeat-containing protein [Patescibacteria group bacterium]